MTETGGKYLVDTNVLIAAYRSYYAFDICPGFWNLLLSGHKDDRIFSTQRVLQEIKKGEDKLSDWVTNQLPSTFFVDDFQPSIAVKYAPMMSWVSKKDFLPAAKAKFATDADGWLVATCKKDDYCLVTQEEFRELAKASIPIPNVCKQFDVKYCNTFDMLRSLSCSFQ